MAGSGTISVNHGSIVEQAKNLAKIKNEMEGILESARGQVASLVESGGFKTKAGDSFNAKYDEWTAATKKSVALLDDMAAYLGKAADAFEKVDEAFVI